MVTGKVFSSPTYVISHTIVSAHIPRIDVQDSGFHPRAVSGAHFQIRYAHYPVRRRSHLGHYGNQVTVVSYFEERIGLSLNVWIAQTTGFDYCSHIVSLK